MVDSPLPPLPYPAAVRPRQPRVKFNQTKQETLREAILLAAAYVGDEMEYDAAEKGQERPGGLLGYLEMVARCDVKAFCSLLGRVLPMQVAGEGGGPLVVEIVKLASDQPVTAGGILVRGAAGGANGSHPTA